MAKPLPPKIQKAIETARREGATKLDLKPWSIGELLTSFPEAVLELTQLESLDLHNQNISAIPQNIATALPRLKRVDVSGNPLDELTDIPGLILDWKQWEKLRDNISIEHVRGLRLRKLGANTIKTITQRRLLERFYNMRELYISGNRLSSLPECIGQLQNLDILDLWGNKLSSLPECIGQLQNLNILNLWDNKLNSLPECIGQLQNLKTLNLWGNQLSSLPESIGQLQNLKTLNLRSNQLSSLPESIGQLQNLKTLNLRSNQLSNLPESIGQLQNLNTLDLWGNKLSSLPESIGQLQSLTELIISSNKLSSLPESITKLQKLTILNLRENYLNTLPVSITKLQNLSELYLRGNQLTTLPESVVKLPRLWKITLDSNPWQEPPPEIIARGLEAIREYFRQATLGTVPLHEAKVLIVGEPGAGKTTLMKKLTNSNYPVPSEEDSTLGIVVHEGWGFHCPIGREVVFRANLWDFGGQEIQYMTHQFFLTSRCLYVLVIDPRRDYSHADYWFHIIDLLGGGSPVLVVLNEKNQKQVTGFDLSAYKKHFQARFTIKDCKVDLAYNDARFSALVETVQKQLCTLKHVGTPLPRAWIPIREELQEHHKLGKHYISFKEYMEICRHHGLQGEKQALLLSGYLHDLGIVLHYQEDPGLADTVILNPQWAVDGVYAVLHRREEIEDRPWHFSRKWVFEFWQEKGYNFEECHKLLRLMSREHFEICYPLTGSTYEEYLVPLLLPEERPTYYFPETDLLHFRYRYQFMPKGLISRLIVRLHPYLEKDNRRSDVVWKRGAVFQHQGARAEVVESLGGEGFRSLLIRIAGASSIQRRELLTIIRHEIEAIHKKSYKNIRYDELIPCHSEKCQKQEAPNFFELSDLHKHLSFGDREVRCLECGEKMDIFRLIGAVIPPEETKNIRETGEPIRIQVEVQGAVQAKNVATETESGDTTGKDELNELENIKKNLKKKARIKARRFIWVLIGVILVVECILAYLTYRIGWNTMEPWTYFLGFFFGIILPYIYFAITLDEPSPLKFYKKLQEKIHWKLYKEIGLEP